ncbi:hypothetical protein ACHAXA_003678 [Cyclostephanos tholiformis]|uniref:SnoaL-like domain-containing protein n=1 Tax=Cyclostephanos tholiformis TaxID=382380 RepID=A0ABD3SP41_9STRA
MSAPGGNDGNVRIDDVPNDDGELSETERASISLASRRLDLYNAREVDPFMALFSDDVVVTDSITGNIIASNREEMRPRYVERFESSPVRCELISRTVLENVVIDREVITGLPNGAAADVIATYVCDIEGDVIKRVSFVWHDRTISAELVVDDDDDDDDEDGKPTASASDGDGNDDVVVVVDALTRIGLPSPLILGSASYTRRSILSEMNVPYVRVVRPIDECEFGDRSGNVDELVATLAHAKMDRLIDEIRVGNCDDELPSSSSISASSSGGKEMGRVVDDDIPGRDGFVILTADQVVTHGDRILEKPNSIEEAREFVMGYADGTPVTTHGACVIAHHPSGHRVHGIDTASVYFDASLAGCDLVDRLLGAGEPILGCAGGLMIEHPYVREHVVRIDGTEDSVMGLSKDLVERLLLELREKLDGVE